MRRTASCTDKRCAACGAAERLHRAYDSRCPAGPMPEAPKAMNSKDLKTREEGEEEWSRLLEQHWGKHTFFTEQGTGSPYRVLDVPRPATRSTALQRLAAWCLVAPEVHPGKVTLALFMAAPLLLGVLLFLLLGVLLFLGVMAFVVYPALYLAGLVLLIVGSLKQIFRL